MNAGDAVLVFSERCSFLGERGVVTQVQPLMVLLEGERLPMAFSPNEVASEQESTRNLGGAE